MNVVHVTHEAVEKMGGIGTVIDGLTTAEAYAGAVGRTILLGPLFSTDQPAGRRLGAGSTLLYSSLDEVHPHPWREKFLPIERTYDVGIVYGKRNITEPYTGKEVEVEVLVLDVFHTNKVRLNLFKGELFEKFGIASHQFQNVWDYEQYVRLAEPGFEALRAIGACDEGEQMLLLSHEYMGMPTVLKAVLDGADNVKTVFYAHEVASVRPIVEDLPGHDTMFYNVMKQARKKGLSLEAVFPETLQNYKHPLVRAARYCDHVFAVGDYVEAELHFLDSHFDRMGIDLVYNGIQAEALSLEEKYSSRALLKKYTSNLTGNTPDWIFTHVARPVRSKGIWRDLRVLHEMEPLLAERGETVVYFMLGTLAGQRRRHDIRNMEQSYGWPVTHEQGYPDMCGGEEVVGEMFDIFNRTHTASRVILVNQWGWSPNLCGQRMPAEMTIADLRRGADLEFGLSVYEPFGISQLESLSFGAMCVLSNICGCAAFCRTAAGDDRFDNILVGDFLGVDENMPIEGLLQLDVTERDGIESREGKRLAEIIIDRLPRDEEDLRRRIRSGYELARRMSWERVVQDYFLPSLSRAANE
jgi:glycosyltransferase involved in cell wall biosynthesis